jgi:D-proline reductase (dithiol) PrdB
VEPPFDLEGEKNDPSWGDPTYRTIPSDISQAEVGASHLHINTRDVLADINILLPVDRFRELAAEGRIGGVAQNAYSLMGYQGFPPDTTAWEETYGPEIAHKLKQEGVSCVLLTPA